MPPTIQPVFGKRNAPQSRAGRPVTAGDDHAAFFEAARADLADAAETRTIVVPRAFTGAFLAGLVTGCALAGFDVTGDAGTARLAAVAAPLGLRIDTTHLLPATILLGLLGGARAAAMTIIFVHWLLARAGWTGHAAYALGGAAASAGLALAALVALGHAPLHGWAVEVLAGASSGFFYRVFAGARAS